MRQPARRLERTSRSAVSSSGREYVCVTSSVQGAGPRSVTRTTGGFEGAHTSSSCAGGQKLYSSPRSPPSTNRLSPRRGGAPRMSSTGGGAQAALEELERRLASLCVDELRGQATVSQRQPDGAEVGAGAALAVEHDHGAAARRGRRLVGDVALGAVQHLRHDLLAALETTAHIIG